MTSFLLTKASNLPRNSATRERLVKTAERLFAKHGINGVSLNDINTTAGQRNKNATHYYFGDKNGLIKAVVERHQIPIILRRDRLLQELAIQGTYNIRGVVRAMLYPVAEKLFDPDGGREFIAIAAELTPTFAAVINGVAEDVFHLAGSLQLINAARRKTLQHLPEPVYHQRVQFCLSLILHGLADHARELSKDGEGAAANTELIIRNMEDCLVAICEAEVSADVIALVDGAATHLDSTFPGPQALRR